MKTEHISKWGACLGAGIIVFGLAGCADRNKNGQPDSVATEGEVSRAADKAGDQISNAADKTADATSNAAKKVEPALSNAGKVIGNALEPAVVTPKVKTAIGANAALKGSMIDVSTDGPTNTVSLTGTVKSDAQKKLAESITKKEANGYKISNKLVVHK